MATLEALLAASYRLSRTVTTGEAADELAETACALTGADGAHVHLPEQVGGHVLSNANEARTTAPRHTLSFDLTLDAPDLVECLATGHELFVADGLAQDALRRPLRLRHHTASLLFVPLLDLGVLVLWWEQPQAVRPVFGDGWPAFVAHFAQALRRRLETTRLRDLSLTDPLTGLANRRALTHVLGEMSSGSGLLLIDLDHFKAVNDSHGHRYGDQALQQFAELLKEYAPQALCLARYGGEEFAVVFPSDARNSGVQAFTELRLEWRARGMTFSAGLADHRHGATGEETLEAADRALYRAKQSGRDQLAHAADVAWTDEPLQSWPPAPAALRGMLDAPLGLDDLDEVLRRGLVAPHYQPIVDTRTGRVVAVEALARLTHPHSGHLLMPTEFLPLAERTGRVRQLDRQVAAAAIEHVATWRADPQLAELTVGVNVSVDHLDDQDLPDFFLTSCRRSRLPLQALTVEITETLQSVTGRGHESSLQELHEAGVRIALDDFGTGFSSLSYLLRFPVSAIKIDKSFTAALGSPRGQHLVQGILQTAITLGLDVVAEGIETPHQLAWLTAQGCPRAQGYLLSCPVPGSELPAAVRRLHTQAHARPA